VVNGHFVPAFVQPNGQVFTCFTLHSTTTVPVPSGTPGPSGT
jgi:hypothetical protein